MHKGVVRINLFLDGLWTQVKMDNYLPCSIGGNSNNNTNEDELLQKAIEISLLEMNNNNDNNNSSDSTTTNTTAVEINNPYAKKKTNNNNNQMAQQIECPPPLAISENNNNKKDPNGLSGRTREIMIQTMEFMDYDRKKKQQNSYDSSSSSTKGASSSLSSLYRPRLLEETIATSTARRVAQTRDLAYSKAHKNQLWVPFLEKAYAKIHGSYQAISGGHIAEAFLDLTG